MEVQALLAVFSNFVQVLLYDTKQFIISSMCLVYYDIMPIISKKD